MIEIPNKKFPAVRNYGTNISGEGGGYDTITDYENYLNKKADEIIRKHKANESYDERPNPILWHYAMQRMDLLNERKLHDFTKTQLAFYKERNALVCQAIVAK